MDYNKKSQQHKAVQQFCDLAILQMSSKIIKNRIGRASIYNVPEVVSLGLKPNLFLKAILKLDRLLYP